jgi:hypothetical protein
VILLAELAAVIGLTAPLAPVFRGNDLCDRTRVMESDQWDPNDATEIAMTPPEQPSEGTSPADEKTESSSGRRDLALTLLALGGTAAMMFGLLVLRGEPSSAASVVPVTKASMPSSRPPMAPALPPIHAVWSAANREHYVGANRKGVAFELPADSRISVWTRTVQPSLVVRCIAGRVDAFVVTDSAAKIEAGTDDHTVTYGFDNAADTTERWPDSSEHDALFAPDGSQFAMRIAAARVMRFGFTPHNAAAATTTFQVDGLVSLMESSAKECGLRSAASASRHP